MFVSHSNMFDLDMLKNMFDLDEASLYLTFSLAFNLHHTFKFQSKSHLS